MSAPQGAGPRAATTPFAQSIARTGLKAGAAFAVSVAIGVLLALVLGGGLFFFYLSRLNGAGVPAARAGGAGAALALLVSPSALVGVLLFAFVPIYILLGVAQGRTRALRQVVAAHGDSLTERLASAIADRIEAMPRAHGALKNAAEGLSGDALSRQLAPSLGNNRALRAVIAFVVKRLPLSDLLAQWQKNRVQVETPGAPASATPGQDAALRATLHQRVGEALQQVATPSHTLLWIALGAHVVVLCVGMWLTR